MDRKIRRPKLVIFDMDGTISDTELMSIDGWEKVSLEYDIKFPLDLLYSFIGKTNSSVKKKCLELYGNDFPYEEIYEKRKAYELQQIDTNLKLKVGVYEILDSLEKLGIKKAIATSSSVERTTKILTKANILNRFDFIITGDMVEKSKPNPEIFLKCMEKIGVNPLDTLVVEDSKNGIIAANRSGAVSVLIPDLILPDEEMTNRSNYIFKSLLELKDFIEICEE